MPFSTPTPGTAEDLMRHLDLLRAARLAIDSTIDRLERNESVTVEPVMKMAETARAEAHNAARNATAARRSAPGSVFRV